MKSLVACCTLSMLTLGVAQEARAQGGIFLSPFVGTTLTSPSNTGSKTKPGFGAALGHMGTFFGGELEVMYYPEILDNPTTGLSQNKVVTAGANTLIGPTIGPVKVYGAIGSGALYLNVKSASSIVVPNPQATSSTYFSFNAGGGVVVYFGHIGLRGDLRYFKAFGFNLTDVEAAGPKLDQFDFWRAGVGLVIH